MPIDGKAAPDKARLEDFDAPGELLSPPSIVQIAAQPSGHSSKALSSAFVELAKSPILCPPFA
jgi:hypothetical protein